MTQNLELELQKSNLKVQALLQTTSELHNQIAEYRAEVTILAEQLRQTAEALEEATETETEEVEVDNLLDKPEPKKRK